MTSEQFERYQALCAEARNPKDLPAVRRRILLEAINCALDRIHSHPDLQWVAGWGSDLFAQLSEAEVKHAPHQLDELENRR